MNTENDTAGYDPKRADQPWYPPSPQLIPRPAPAEPIAAARYPGYSSSPAGLAPAPGPTRAPGPPPPGYGPPSYGRPDSGPPSYGRPDSGPSGFGPPGFGAPGFGPPLSSQAQPPPPLQPPPLSRPRRRRKGLVAAIVVLLAVVGAQAYVLIRVNQSLDKANARIDAADRDAQQRTQALQSRVADLESSLGRQFNPEAIASAVVPSVFRVKAGDFIGTAFAVGKNTSGGGTNLFTNFHVIESVYSGGGRQVFLERRDQRFPARIVAVDKGHDVAQLQTTSKFTGLTTAGTPVKAGQQIVVVGSPLGLEDTVTTGVVSAFRQIDELAGKVIQFDASINPGNSGGPVINSAKQVVGIASAKARDAEGIGLAVPIATACGKFKIC